MSLNMQTLISKGKTKPDLILSDQKKDAQWLSKLYFVFILGFDSSKYE